MNAKEEEEGNVTVWWRRLGYCFKIEKMRSEDGISLKSINQEGYEMCPLIYLIGIPVSYTPRVLPCNLEVVVLAGAINMLHSR